MNQNIIITAIIIISAISAGLLTWILIDISTVTMARYRAKFTDKANFQAREFFLFIDPGKLFLANLSIMTLGAVLAYVLTGNPFISAGVFFGLTLLPRTIYSWMRKRRLAKFEEQLPDALMMLSGGLRAGVGLTSAIHQLVGEAQPPLSQEFALLLREQRLGVTLEQALNNLSRRIPTQSSILMISAMRIASETGGALAETLERTSHTIRSRLQMEKKIGALTAQGKLQAWIVGSLPIALMFILNKMEPESMSLLWHDRIGWAVLVIIGFLEVLGIYLIRKIVSIDV